MDLDVDVACSLIATPRNAKGTSARAPFGRKAIVMIIIIVANKTKTRLDEEQLDLLPEFILL